MKTTLNSAMRPAGSVPRPAVMPPAASTRPVRHGSFWPGESFMEAHPKPELAEAMAEFGFVLPGIIGRGQRHH
ncbi:MAG: hypothetical protein U1F83_00465 [Verrucomicrobiota bacterium]